MALLRILHITNALGSGGAERLVTDLALTQAAAGHSVSVAVLSPSDALGDTSGLDARRTNALEAAGVTVDLLSPRGRALLVPAAVRLRQRMRSVRPDIVHCHLLKGLLVLRMAGQDVPAIATHHNTPLPTRPWLFRSLARRAACYVAISAAAEPVLRDVYDGPVPVIFNGIAPASISGIPRPAAPPLRILSVGNLKPAKNYPQLADIAAELHKNGVDTSISIVGEGSERRVIEAQVAARGVAGRVTLLGSRQDVPEL
ncbi:MAG: glycosyltransferase, partial [Pseudomonadota bacterium]